MSYSSNGKAGVEHHENSERQSVESHKMQHLHDMESHLFHQFTNMKPSLIQHHGDYVYLDNKKFLKSDLVQAFGGNMNPGWAVPSVHKFGNPAPLGLSAFAYCTFVASLINCGARGSHIDNVNNGAAMFYGGLIQLIAGLWEISLENAFGGLAFSSFGGYWMASASMKIPWFNGSEAYATADELNSAMGFFYLGWLMFTIILLACTIKSTLLFFGLFVLVFLRLLLLTIFRFYDLHSAEVAAGVVGVLAALLAWYHAYAGLATHQNSYYVVDPWPMPVLGKKDDSDDTDSANADFVPAGSDSV
jgi:succinate-acetate transporter protein